MPFNFVGFFTCALVFSPAPIFAYLILKDKRTRERDGFFAYCFLVIYAFGVLCGSLGA